MKIRDREIDKKYIIGGIVLFILALIILIIILFGSNGRTKSLSCTKAEKQGSMNRIYNMNITFKKDAITSANSKYEVQLTDDTYTANIGTAYENLVKQYEDVANEKGVTINPTKTSNSVAVEITVNAKENPDQVTVVGSTITKEMNYETARKALEELGYTCQ